MPLFERDTRKRMDPPDEAQREAMHTSSEASGSSSAADDSAAHIAEMVRRTAERNARPGLSSVRSPGVSAVPRARPAQQVRPPVAQPVARRTTPTRAPRHPSRRVLAAGGAVAAVLIAGGVAMSRPGGSADKPTSSVASSAPASYSVKVTDVITDCASHSHGRTKVSFEAQNCVKATRSLATGRVRGRPALFVVSRIQMASVEAAASVKQVLDATGTGNLNDLLREGKTFPGAPDAMPRSGYASVQTGAVILVAEAGFVDGGSSSNTNPALRAASAQVAAMDTTQS